MEGCAVDQKSGWFPHYWRCSIRAKNAEVGIRRTVLALKVLKPERQFLPRQYLIYSPPLCFSKTCPKLVYIKKKHLFAFQSRLKIRGEKKKHFLRHNRKKLSEKKQIDWSKKKTAFPTVLTLNNFIFNGHCAYDNHEIQNFFLFSLEGGGWVK